MTRVKVHSDPEVADFYHRKRQKGDYRYRLERRTSEVAAAIQSYLGAEPGDILDIGSADGLMASFLAKRFRCTVTGIDISLPLLLYARPLLRRLVQGDALHLPFCSAKFDVVVASAIIEHLPSGREFLAECYRVLRSGGLCIVTTPDPIWDRLTSWLVAFRIGGHEDHLSQWNLNALQSALAEAGFICVDLRKFMLFPFAMPAGECIERAVSACGFSVLLMNQIAVGRKL